MRLWPAILGSTRRYIRWAAMPPRPGCRTRLGRPPVPAFAAARWERRPLSYPTTPCSPGSARDLPLNPLDGCNACKPPEHFGGYRIFRKFGEDFVIALECQSRILGDQSLIGLARQFAEPDGLQIGLQFGTGSEGAQQFVYRYFRPASSDDDIVNRSHAEAISCFLEDAVADAEASPVFLVYPLKARGDVNAVADHGVAHALLGADIADDDGIAVNPDAKIERLQLFGAPALVERPHFPLNAKGGDAGAPSVIFEQHGR